MVSRSLPVATSSLRDVYHTAFPIVGQLPFDFRGQSNTGLGRRLPQVT